MIHNIYAVTLADRRPAAAFFKQRTPTHVRVPGFFYRLVRRR